MTKIAKPNGLHKLTKQDATFNPVWLSVPQLLTEVELKDG